MSRLILDIRTRKEYCTGHLRDAILVETVLPPLSLRAIDMMRRKLTKLTRGLSRGTPIIVYCKKGIRAGIAYRILVDELGFTNVTNYGGVETEPLRKMLK